ncbi:hypothetical protein [Streptomyces sp. CC224B]|uniref:hypothetical protein n=1 Tax=Streptomyces sp. CC224B TaxID=3044571 RepID=UPI0024A8E463|nr:hypothetical protein [Streptomyces sp. CC224B]
MTSEEILALYEWQQGVCFRHPTAGEIPTAGLKALHPRAGGAEHVVRACHACVLQLEDERRAEATERGVTYVPGHAGEPLV